MKLATLLGIMSDSDLHELAKALGNDEPFASVPALANRIEGDVRSRRHVEYFVVARRPPVFSILRQLLQAEEYRRARDELKQDAMAECEQLAARVRTGDLVATERHALYRRVLSEAWRTDLRLDASELSILGVLRRELQLTQADHFLVVEHPDVEPFWRTDDPFDTVLEQLRLGGIVFALDDEVILPADLVPWVREAIGIAMDDEASRRLLDNLPKTTLRKGLEASELRTSGSKSELVDRVVAHFLPADPFLRLMHIHDLKQLANESGAIKSGSKEEVVERIMAHFRDGLDQPEREIEPVETQIQERKRLSRQAFEALFGTLRSLELAAILLGEPSLPASGTKGRRIAVLWEHHRNEASLLAHLGSARLKRVLERLSLRVSGSRAERIERIISHFESGSGASTTSEEAVSIVVRQPSGPPPSSGGGGRRCG